MNENLYNKKFIITGGAGFIGSNIIKMLNDNGIDQIYIIEDLNLKNDVYLNTIGLKYLDVIDKDDFLKIKDRGLFKYGDYLIHQGAISDTLNDNVKELVKNNYEYSVMLLNYSLSKSMNFIYASSASVYGNSSVFKEDYKNEYPLNPYAYSKYLFDNYVRRKVLSRELVNDFNRQVVGLRYFNVYGMQENHKNNMASFFYQTYKRLKNNDPVYLFNGSDEIYRDFIYIKDVVDVVKHFIENTDINGIFNVGSGKPRTFLDVLKILYKLMDFDYSTHKTIGIPNDLKNKYQYYTKADLTNLREYGKYTKEFTSLEDGLSEYFTYLENYGGYFDKTINFYN